MLDILILDVFYVFNSVFNECNMLDVAIRDIIQKYIRPIE